MGEFFLPRLPISLHPTVGSSEKPHDEIADVVEKIAIEDEQEGVAHRTDNELVHRRKDIVHLIYLVFHKVVLAAVLPPPAWRMD